MPPPRARATTPTANAPLSRIPLSPRALHRPRAVATQRAFTQMVSALSASDAELIELDRIDSRFVGQFRLGERVEHACERGLRPAGDDPLPLKLRCSRRCIVA